MKTWIKEKIFPVFANRLNTRFLLKVTDQSLIHVFYHTVSDKYLPHIHPLYIPKTTVEFKKDIDYILSVFSPVSLEDVYLHITGEKLLKKPSVHFSFDDGLSELYYNVVPLFCEKKIPATIFLNKAFVDNNQLFFRHKAAVIIDYLKKNIPDERVKVEISDILSSSQLNIEQQLLKINCLTQNLLDDIASLLGIDFTLYLKEQKPYLTTDEINMMQKNGFTIGGHSIDHLRFEQIDEQAQIYQAVESCKFTQENWKEKYVGFAFPFTDSNVKSSFFSAVYPFIDLTFGISGVGTTYNGRHIQRIDMEKPLVSAKKRINSSLIIAYLKSSFL